MKNMGEFFAKARKDAGLTQTEVAKKLKVKPQFICNWERGVSSPPTKYYARLAKMFGLHKYDVEYIAIRFLEKEIDGLFK